MVVVGSPDDGIDGDAALRQSGANHAGARPRLDGAILARRHQRHPIVGPPTADHRSLVGEGVRHSCYDRLVVVHLLISAVSARRWYDWQVKNEAGVGSNPQLSITGALHKINPLNVNLLFKLWFPQ